MGKENKHNNHNKIYMEQNFFNQWMQCIGSSVFDFCGTPPDGGVGVEAFEVGGDAFGITRLGGVSGGPLAAGLDFNSSIAFKAASSFACSIDSRLWSFIVIVIVSLLGEIIFNKK